MDSSAAIISIASCDEAIVKAAVVVFALADDATPARIAPNAKGFPGLRLMSFGNSSFDLAERHSAMRPSFARFDRQVAATQKPHRFPDERGIRPRG